MVKEETNVTGLDFLTQCIWIVTQGKCGEHYLDFVYTSYKIFYWVLNPFDCGTLSDNEK